MKLISDIIIKMSESKIILNHSVHLKTLIAHADSKSMKDCKELIDYLILYKAANHAELILQKGIEFCEIHSSSIADSMKTLLNYYRLLPR